MLKFKFQELKTINKYQTNVQQNIANGFYNIDVYVNLRVKCIQGKKREHVEDQTYNHNDN